MKISTHKIEVLKDEEENKVLFINWDATTLEAEVLKIGANNYISSKESTRQK